MELLIVTGMSGAGKTQVAHVLEDIGYYCVDNIPPMIIPHFADLFACRKNEFQNLAIVTDIRGGQLFNDITKVLKLLKSGGTEYKILFLDASQQTLIRRYKENRRRHPLCSHSSLTLSAAVEKEAHILSVIKKKADYIVDTTDLSVAQLRSHIVELFLGDNADSLKIQCLSFGFKYGIPADADLVFDVRCLPNPFYVDDMRARTGLDKDIQDFVMNSPDSIEFLERILSFIDFLIPLYRKEGKNQLVVAVGCTGGKHRSVTFAQKITEHLNKNKLSGTAMHRDINKF